MYSMLSRTYQVLLYHAGIPVCYYYYDMYQYICTEVLYVIALHLVLLLI